MGLQSNFNQKQQHLSWALRVKTSLQQQTKLDPKHPSKAWLPWDLDER
jgi:hypothetical protein